MQRFQTHSAKFVSSLLALSLIPLGGITDIQTDTSSLADGLKTEIVESAPAVAEELVVKYKGEKKARVVKLSRGKSIKDAAREFRLRGDVEYAEPNYIAYALMVPNDPYYGYQWNMKKIGMESAWDIHTGTGVTVAVIDTGVAYENFTQGLKNYYRAPDLGSTAFAPGYDFVHNDTHPNDDNGHGTHVAGTVAGSTNNNLGVAGVAFAARVMPIKVLGKSGSGTYADVADGIRFAADNGAKVINLSLGGSATTTYLEEAVAYAYEKDVTIVAAAGNGGVGSVTYPAAYDTYVIAVGATRYDDAHASYSNYGASLDIMAPGGDTSVDQNGDGYGDGILQQTFQGSNYGAFSYYFFQGTSMASPHVAGVAALVIANGNATTTTDVRAALQESARDLGAPGRDDTFGYGLVDASIALAWGAPPPPPPPPPVAPTVDLKIDGIDGPLTIASGATSTLSWITTNAPSTCTAFDAWSGSKNPAGGSEITFPLTGPATSTYTLLCTNTAGTSTDSVIVNVEAPVPPPPPPTEIEVFFDSFEVSEWNGLWTEDSQNDWYRSSQRATEGTHSAEVDGRANNATLTSSSINLQGKTNASVSFSWLIEDILDTNEYVSFEVSTNNGTSWTEMGRLLGNVSQENVWHSASFNLTGVAGDMRLRFKGKMSGSAEDANVDAVKVVAY